MLDEHRRLSEKKIASAIRDELNRHGQMILTANGQSMFPYIQQSDICTFSRLEKDSALKRGCIVLYQNDSGRLIAHRYLRTNVSPDGWEYFLIKGDSNLYPDPPVAPGQLIGVLTGMKAAKHRLRISHLSDRAWCRMILDVPRLSWLINKYLNLRSRAKKKITIDFKRDFKRSKV
ncbi:S24/S26 family peptidase [Sporolactobacillus pectinivorans]|uniref:S24/S26 family peptidase n=1 Tax=Sporolactobacillus pectinivorans TaxID=1591408 RepID=UPI0012FE4A40|nr:S24/S26 family peptidase [Sporolactobacillus pectinivorans]